MTIFIGKIRKTTLLSLAVLLIAIPRGIIADDQPVVLAIVNGDSITTADIDRRFMSSHMSMSDDSKASFDYRKLLDKLINDRLIVQEAELLEMDQEEQFATQLNETCDKYRRKVFLEEIFKPVVEIDDSQIVDRFNRFYWKIQLRSVSLRTLEEAQQVRAMIENGAPMDSIAEATSLDSRRFRGGLGNLQYWLDVINDFKPAVENLEVGQMCQPVQYREAFTILRVEQRHPADTADFENVKNSIKRDITKERRYFAWVKFLDSLKSVYPVEVDQNVVADISADKDILFDGAFLKESDLVAVTVSGEPAATETDRRTAISYQAMNASTSPFDSVLQMGISEITENAVFDYAAEANGYDNNERVVLFCDNLRDSTLIEVYLQETVLPGITFNHAEFDKYFEENKESFRLPDQVRLQNLFITAEEVARDASRSLAEGADFDFVARKFNAAKDDQVDETKWYDINSFPASVSNAFDTTRVGGTTDAFPVKEGWIIFRIADRRKGDLLPEEKIDMEIRKVMFQRKFNESMDHMLALMKDNSEIVYFEDRIASYLGETTGK